MDHERCDACGVDGGHYDDQSLLAALHALGPRWRTLLGGAGSELRERPAPEAWSAIEYAAHSRDVTALHAFGIEQALRLDEPSFPPIAGDLVESASATYAGSDPGEVLDALDEHATALAALAGDAGSDTWSRGITIGGDRSDVRRLLEHALHDSLHHVDDVERGYLRLRG